MTWPRWSNETIRSLVVKRPEGETVYRTMAREIGVEYATVLDWTWGKLVDELTAARKRTKT